MAELLSYFKKGALEAGCDEAGRGCLSGPVFAASVILPKKFKHPLLDDSKKLTESQRNLLRGIIEKEAICYGVAMMTNHEIDKVNILKASFLSMHKAIDQLTQRPELLLIDGNRFIPYQDIPHECIIKGDGKYLSIAAASVLAKTYRDEFMENLHQKHPEYKWNTNKGYPTIEHRKAIQEFGPTDYHRMSFTLLAEEQLSMFD